MKIGRVIVYILLFIASGGLGMGSHVKENYRISCRLKIDTSQDNCQFTLKVSNNLDNEAVLKFTTSQQYDFIVKSIDGKIVWQWSSGMMFTQAFTTLTLNPYEKKTFTETCRFPDGEYIAQGVLTTIPEKIHTDWIKFKIQGFVIPALKGKITRILDKLYLLGSDGTVYLIDNPSEEIEKNEDKTIEVISSKIEAIPGTIDKKIIIEEFR